MNKKKNNLLLLSLFTLTAGTICSANFIRIFKDFKKKYSNSFFPNQTTMQKEKHVIRILNVYGQVETIETENNASSTNGFKQKNMLHLNEKPKQTIEDFFFDSSANEYKKNSKYTFLEKCSGVPKAKAIHYKQAEKIIGKPRKNFTGNDIKILYVTSNKKIENDKVLKKVKQKHVKFLKQNKFFKKQQECFLKKNSKECTSDITNIYMDTITTLCKTLFWNGEKNILYKICLVASVTGHPENAKSADSEL
ncbi:hypothetical protein KAH94_02395 [bacterium]|nr:hypothetical protein [bacterium]